MEAVIGLIKGRRQVISPSSRKYLIAAYHYAAIVVVTDGMTIVKYKLVMLLQLRAASVQFQNFKCGHIPTIR
jgi:hypothetical protein